MAKQADRPAIKVTGEEDQILHATWSRSGKNMVLTVAPNRHSDDFQQVLLSTTQAADLARFLAAGPNPT
jgi:hypothetical protein